MSNENNLETIAEEVSDTVEEVTEEVTEVTEDAAEEAAEIAEDAAAAVEDVAEEAAETAEDVAEEAAETAEDAAEEAAETAEDVAEEAAETAEEIKDTVAKEAADIKPKAAASKSAPVIKKKKGINTTTLIVLIVCIVVVLACVWFVGYKLGWWHVPTKADYTIKAHDTIEISEADLEISEDSIESYVTRFQDAYAVTDEVTTGTVEDGDVVYISYVGTKDGVAFDGGSSDGYELTIGSGTFIDGFEDGLIGANIGDTVTLNLTFPEDYSTAELAGEDVVFEVNILHKDVTVTPEFTDDFVKENSAEYTETTFGESVQLDTMEAYRTHVHDYLYDMHLDDSLEDALDELIEVKSYDEVTYNLIYDEQQAYMEQAASYYGMDAATLASYYGFESLDDYLADQTEFELRLAMLYSSLAEELGITHTDEDVDAALLESMEENGYTDTYTLEEFKEMNGEAGMYMFKNYQMNYEPVIEAMRERIVIVPATEEETSEETSAE